MGVFGSTRKSSRTTNNYDYDASQDHISQQGYNTSSSNIGDIHQGISASKSNVNYTATDHGSVQAGKELGESAIRSNTAISHQALLENSYVIENALASNDATNQSAFSSIDNVNDNQREIAEMALFSGVEMVDTASLALENANNNMLDATGQTIDFIDGANDRLLGVTERMGQDFAANTESIFDTAMTSVNDMALESSRTAYDLSSDFMMGLEDAYDKSHSAATTAYDRAFTGTTGAFNDSLSTVARNAVYANDSILALSRDSGDLIESAYDNANTRFTDALERHNSETVGMLASLVNQTADNTASQFNSALAQIDATTQDAYKMVQESAKSEGERTTDTLIKFAVGGIALVGIAFALTRGK